MYEYDAIPYLSQPFGQTHPDRLATIATLYGLHPPCPARSRVLEIACGAGDNLLPMALALPSSDFIGIDRAESAIQRARAEANELGLSNIQFLCHDLLDVDASIGAFDFIVAHGFYSWVPKPVQDKLLHLIRETMTPNGLAYVSYNTYPGSYFRQVIREMCLYHVQDIADPSERIHSSVEFVDFFSGNNVTDDACRRLLIEESQRFTKKHPSFIYHDDLSSTFDPVYFHQFAQHAQEHKLTYVSEAHFMDMGEGVFSPDAMQAMDKIARQQYLDFLRCRRFRQSILCHEAAQPAAAPNVGRIRQLSFASRAKVAGSTISNDQVSALLLRNRGGPEVTIPNDFIDSSLATNIIEVLSGRWPETVSCAEMLELRTAATEGELCGALLKLYQFDLLEMHVLPRLKRRTHAERPSADLLARRAADSGLVTSSLLHERVHIGDLSKEMLPLLDGSRTSESLCQELRISGKEISPELLRKELTELATSGLLEW